jgi:hypothetical protein
MTWIFDKLIERFGVNATSWILGIFYFVTVFAIGYWWSSIGSGKEIADLKAGFAEASAAWEMERRTASAKALAESEAQRANERGFTAALAQAAKEKDDAKTELAAVRARAGDTERQLRNARSAITAALNRKEWAASAACFRAADATVTALEECSNAYRGVAYQYGECLAGMQMIGKTWNAAREMCR